MSQPLSPADLKCYLEQAKTSVERLLDSWFREPKGPALEIHSAMRHSQFAGGKRIRPALCLAAAESLGASREDALPWAAAFEMIHTYTLIHDDLPALDNDDLRRGQPTCHKVFGEAIAILAGLGLLAEAFRLGSGSALPGERGIKLIHNLARACGPSGVLAGQVADLMAERELVDAQGLRFIHIHKTADLLAACLLAGGLIAGASEPALACLHEFGMQLGLAFQIKDDILDEEGEQALIGKPVGSDKRRQKSTYLSLFGIERTRQLLDEAHQQAIASLEGFPGQTGVLLAILDFVVQRSH